MASVDRTPQFAALQLSAGYAMQHVKDLNMRGLAK